MATITESTTAEAAPATSPPDRAETSEQRVILRGVSWETYQKLSEELGDQGGLKSFNRGVLELMSPGFSHEKYKKLIGHLIQVTAEELNIPCTWMGSTTWDDPEARRGLEPDECYLLTPEKVAEVARADPRHSRDLPRPDLAVEVDLSPHPVDRSEIHATLGVAEVWRFDGVTLRIDRLRGDGLYEQMAASGFLPVPPAEVERWVVAEPSGDGSAWTRRLRAWVREALVKPGGENV